MKTTARLHTLTDARGIYELPLTTLILRAQETHHRHHDPSSVMMCALKSIKTGACPEDCSYCPQSSRNHASVPTEPLMETEAILREARRARAGDAVRFCMGAAWRSVKDGRQFDSVLASVGGVKALGLQVCCTLGMLTADQARRLREAGCDVYNHNLDTSREFYPAIITTRTYDDRLETLARVREAGMQVCSGGILGMGESVDDRLEMLVELANLNPQPDSVPINALEAVEGTPLEGRPLVDTIEFVRTLATARILMPKAVVRLSAGRARMSDEMQALCFLAGVNSIFVGERLLTSANPSMDHDRALLSRLGLKPAEGAQSEPEPEKDRHPMNADGIWARACTGDGHCEEETVRTKG
ncbi:MAG: biotin synthase BioB [Opitutaceae bacterium]|jgi:biotin synthase